MSVNNCNLLMCEPLCKRFPTVWLTLQKLKLERYMKGTHPTSQRSTATKNSVCSLHAQCVFTPCTVYVHFMHSVCSLHAQCVFTPCTVCVHSMHSVCSLHAQCMFTSCTVCVHFMHSVCSLHAQCVFTPCTVCVHSMHSVCSLHAQCMFSVCVLCIVWWAVLCVQFCQVVRSCTKMVPSPPPAVFGLISLKVLDTDTYVSSVNRTIPWLSIVDIHRYLVGARSISDLLYEFVHIFIQKW